MRITDNVIELASFLSLNTNPEHLAYIAGHLVIYDYLNHLMKRASSWGNLEHDERLVTVLAAEYAWQRLPKGTFESCTLRYRQVIRDNKYSLRRMIDEGYVQFSDAISAFSKSLFIEVLGSAPFNELEHTLETNEGIMALEWNDQFMHRLTRKEVLCFEEEGDEDATVYMLARDIEANTEQLLQEARMFLCRSNRYVREFYENENLQYGKTVYNIK